jgi:hypothetical protein
MANAGTCSHFWRMPPYITPMKLFSVEVGIRQQRNLCRMMASIIVVAESPADSISYVEHHCPKIFTHTAIQRVFEVEHVIVNWPCQSVSIVETKPGTVLV